MATTPASPEAPVPPHVGRGTVYLLHFNQRYQHAGHYTGWADDLDHRLAQHQRGAGARLVEVITQAGIGFRVARLWPGASKAHERSLKNSGGASRYCPICKSERKARGELLRPPRGNSDRHDHRANRAAPSPVRNRGRAGAEAVPTRGVRPEQARAFMQLNPAFARPISGSLAQQWGRVRGREEIEALGPRVSGARFEENQPLSQKRTTAIVRRAVQARVQARQRQLDDQAERTRTSTVAARAHQRLTTAGRQRNGERPATRGRTQPSSQPREGGHER